MGSTLRMKMWLVEDAYDLRAMVVHRVYEHQRWSTMARKWGSGSLRHGEPAFIESHEGGERSANGKTMSGKPKPKVPRPLGAIKLDYNLI